MEQNRNLTGEEASSDETGESDKEDDEQDSENSESKIESEVVEKLRGLEVDGASGKTC